MKYEREYSELKNKYETAVYNVISRKETLTKAAAHYGLKRDELQKEIGEFRCSGKETYEYDKFPGPSEVVTLTEEKFLLKQFKKKPSGSHEIKQQSSRASKNKKRRSSSSFNKNDSKLQNVHESKSSGSHEIKQQSSRASKNKKRRSSSSFGKNNSKLQNIHKGRYNATQLQETLVAALEYFSSLDKDESKPSGSHEIKQQSSRASKNKKRRFSSSFDKNDSKLKNVHESKSSGSHEIKQQPSRASKNKKRRSSSSFGKK